MKSIEVHIPTLLRKIQEMACGNMSTVRLTINEEITDQDVLFPAFLHFEAFTADGSAMDYESVDSISRGSPIRLWNQPFGFPVLLKDSPGGQQAPRSLPFTGVPVLTAGAAGARCAE